MKSYGRMKMEAAENAMRAARAADELTGKLATAKSAADLARLKQEAFDLQGLFPLHAARFADVVSAVNERLNPRPDLLADVKADTGFLVKDRKAQKMRRGIAARQAGRDTRDSGLWDHYEAFRSMKRHLDLAQKEKRRLTRKQAAQRVIDSSKGAITIEAESLVRYFRDWPKRPKRKSGSD